MAANVMEIYGSKVFNEHVMKERLPSATYKSCRTPCTRVHRWTSRWPTLWPACMKRWAMEQGATHYTHWFQPLTGITTEKHDGFVSPQATAPPSWSSPARSCQGRAGRFLLPLRRPARHLRGPRLHRMGPHQLRLREG